MLNLVKLPKLKTLGEAMFWDVKVKHFNFHNYLKHSINTTTRLVIKLSKLQKVTLSHTHTQCYLLCRLMETGNTFLFDLNIELLIVS